MAQIRFRDLVKESGQPSEVTLWSSPENDPQFSKAIKDNKVLTVIRDGTVDSGQIGFYRAPQALYLVFPHPLRNGPGEKVVGIKYDLLEKPKPGLMPHLPCRRGKSPARTPEKKFTIVVRRMAVIERTVSVTAANDSQAKEKALAAVKNGPFDYREAVMQDHVKSITGAGDHN